MTKVYKIRLDADVAIPPREKYSTGSYSLHPLSLIVRKLKPGQSFIYPASTNECRNRLR